MDHAAAMGEIKSQQDRVNDIIKEHETLFERDPKTTKDRYEELHDYKKNVTFI